MSIPYYIIQLIPIAFGTGFLLGVLCGLLALLYRFAHGPRESKYGLGGKLAGWTNTPISRKYDYDEPESIDGRGADFESAD